MKVKVLQLGLFILLVLMKGTVWCQVKEDILNRVYDYKVDSSFQNCNVSPDAHRIFLSEFDSTILHKDLKPYLTQKQISELITNAQKDTHPTNWDFKLLPFTEGMKNFKFYNELYGISISPKGKWNLLKRRKIKKRKHLQIEAYKKASLEEKTVFSFSRPIFSQDQKFFMIKMSARTGNTSGQGCLYIFQIENGDCVLLTKTLCKIS